MWPVDPIFSSSFSSALWLATPGRDFYEGKCYIYQTIPDIWIFTMFQAITGLFKKSPYQRSAQLVYTKMVEQARTPYFYRNLGVADNLDGRFDMICLHLYLVLDRLENEPQASEMAQNMVNYMISDVDRNFREMGVGDMSVGKKVKKLAAALYGRLEAYQVAGDKISVDSGAAFEDALCRNIYRSDDHGDLPLASLRQYVDQQKQFLAALNIEDLLQGNITFWHCGEFV